MKPNQYLFITLAVIALLVLGACSSQPTAKPAPAPAPTPTSTPALSPVLTPTPTPTASLKPTPTPEKPIEWTLGHTTEIPGTPYQEFSTKEFGSRLEKATNGRLRVKTVVGVLKTGEGFTGVREGRLQATTEVYSYLDSTYPMWNVLVIPGLARNDEDTIKPYKEVVVPMISKDTERIYGATMVAHGFWAGKAFFSNKQLKTVEDFKGFKVRTASTLDLMFVKAAGGAAVSMPWGEVYTSLQRGLVDGAVGTVSTSLGSKINEVVKYINWWPLGNPGWGVFVSQKALNDLPADLRSQVQAEFAKMGVMEKPDFDARNNNTKKLVESGMVEIKPSVEELAKAKTQTEAKILEDWYKLTGEKEGKELISKVKASLGY